MLKKLYIFVEGDDDERFMKGVMKPLFRHSYDDVEVIQYAQLKSEKVDNFIKAITTLGFDYIFTGDMDFAQSVNEKKSYLKRRFNLLEDKFTFIVITEIESWYLAGVTRDTAAALEIEYAERTDAITKEDFNKYYRGNFKSRIDFMRELIKRFSMDIAREKNRSFDYFYKMNILS